MRGLKNIGQVLFLDIETIPKVAEYGKLSKEMKGLFDSKFDWMPEADFTKGSLGYEKFYQLQAATCSEFCKIIAVALGYIKAGKGDEGGKVFMVKSFVHDNEILLLEKINEQVESTSRTLCAHSGLNFDFPVIARRCIINGIEIPEPLDNYGKKPWDVALLDTMEAYKCGQWKYSTSLDLLCQVLGIKVEKKGMNGSQVFEVWKKKQYKKIGDYVRSDVVDEAQVYAKLSAYGMPFPKVVHLEEDWKSTTIAKDESL